MILDKNMVTAGFYDNPNVVELARDLIGKTLITNYNEMFTSGRIVETEAYSGLNDKACHAVKGKTPRTAVMYLQGGRSYVYLCYGIHHLFNIVTNKAGLADAVLIRALEPQQGVEAMLERRQKKQLDRSLTSGPGSVAKAMGINMNQYGDVLTGQNQIWIQDQERNHENQLIKCSPRIGVGYALEDANLPWRFYEAGNKWVSGGKPIYH